MNPADDRRNGAGRRLGTDRRWIVDLSYAGRERRSGERRYNDSRRKTH